MFPAIAIWLVVYYLVLALALLVTQKPKPAPRYIQRRNTMKARDARLSRAPGIR